MRGVDYPDRPSTGTRCLATTSRQRYKSFCGEQHTITCPLSNASPLSSQTNSLTSVISVRNILRIPLTCLKNADRYPISGPTWSTICTDMKQRQYRYFKAIAYQAIWFAHIAARESEQLITVQKVSQTYYVLLEHYRKRTTSPTLRSGWPEKNILAIYFTPPF